VEEVSPGILLAAHSDGAPVDSAHPAHAGDKLILFAVGLGPVDQPIGTGELAQDDIPAATVYPVTVLIRDQKAVVDFAGLLPGVIGVYRINVTVPGDTAAGAAPIAISVNDHTAPPVDVPVT
jgi:uncharacterized protein (TIGR03437 family)